MQLTHKAIELIKKHEGLRLTAYRCPADFWTIGYGHTSAAGAPKVVPGMKITREEADAIFKRDIEKFSEQVKKLVKVELEDNQFGACVSLAFNIGIPAFAKSSVLRFINKSDFDNAADAFLLWNKATKNGRKVVLPGLAKRRAEEVALFKEDDGNTEDRIPATPKGKSPLKSTTNIAATVTAAAGVSAAARDVVENTNSIFSGGNMLTIALILVIVGGAAWIIRERWMKSKNWDV